MKCKKIQKKLSAYLDTELKEKETRIISEHLEKCLECKKEFIALLQQDEFLKQIEAIEPSFDFSTTFWQKAQNLTFSVKRTTNYELRTTNYELRITNYELRTTKWLIPVSVTFCIIIFLFLIFSILSPVLYSQDIGVNKRVFGLVKKTVVGFSQSSIFSCVNFINFCDEYCKILCESYCERTGSKCICGRCK